MNNQKKAERACRRFTKARKRQNYITSILGTEGRMLAVGDDILLSVAGIKTTESVVGMSPLIRADVTAVLRGVNVSAEAGSPDADMLATQAAELAAMRAHDRVTLGDLEDARVPLSLGVEDASIVASYIEHSLNVLGDGLAFRVETDPIDAVISAPVLYPTDDAPAFDADNILPLAQAKFEAMVAV